MGFRFWKRIKIAPGVTLNISKSGLSTSLGPRGAKVTIGSGGKRVTAGIPGSGIFYTHKLRTKKNTGGGHEQSKRLQSQTGNTSLPDFSTIDSVSNRLSPGFLRKLLTPKDEKAFVDGCRELFLGNEKKALEYLEEAVHLADGAYLAGFLALKYGKLEKAGKYLSSLSSPGDGGVGKSNRVIKSSLGKLFAKYGISAEMSLPVTDEISVHVEPDLRGVLLGLVEVYQRQERRDDALSCLGRLLELEPDDPVIILSMVELLMDTLKNSDSEVSDVETDDREVLRKVVRMTEGVKNETAVHAAILLYRAKAMKKLGLIDAAVTILTGALRRKKDRSDDLLRALRYERALVYMELGRKKRAQTEFEKIYVEDPGYEDVSRRLGLD